MTPVSAVVLTLNEEQRLPDALESVRFCDEVLVVDAGSTDRTRELAEAAGARVLVNTPWPGFAEQRRFATLAATHPWVLAVDADERVTPGLRDEIRALQARGFEHSGYRIARAAFYLGRWIRGTDWYPDAQLRLFDRRRGGWQGGLVHESVKVDGTVGRLRCELEHHPYEDISDHVITIDRYTTLWARQAFDEGRRTGSFLAVGAAAFAFFRNYVLRRGFLLGPAGLTVSTLNAYYTYLKLAKLAEMTRAAPPS